MNFFIVKAIKESIRAKQVYIREGQEFDLTEFFFFLSFLHCRDPPSYQFFG